MTDAIAIVGVSLNAPQGFMLIPTVWVRNVALEAARVLMPLRASCSFQQETKMKIYEVRSGQQS